MNSKIAKSLLGFAGWALLCGWLAPANANAAWHKTQAGPFEIYTDQDLRAAKQLLGDLEQLRYMLERLTGVEEPKPLWPIRIVIAKGQSPTNLQLTTQYWQLVAPAATLSREQMKQVAISLLHPNSGPLPPELEAGLLSVLAGLTSRGSRVTLGALPPASEQTPDWVLLNFLITGESYQGRVRVFLGNLARGADKASALRNAFETDEAALREKAAAARPQFAPVTFPAKPILPERDYRARTVDNAEAALELAIAKLDRGGCLGSKEIAALECLAVSSRDAEEAKAAIEAGSKNPHMHYIAAVHQEDRLEHQRQLFTAIQLKPLYPQAALAFAAKENDPGKAFRAMRDASPAAQRDANFQAKYAEVAAKANEHATAARAWAAAERATFDPAARERMANMRLESMDRKLEAEAEARRLAEEERLRDIERVRQESLARVRLAEAKARGKMDPLPDDVEILDWWDGAQANAYFTGRLTRVECLGKGEARFTIEAESGPAANRIKIFDVPDPSKLVLIGKKNQTLNFRCGNQTPAPLVKAGFQQNEMPEAPPAAAKVEVDPTFQVDPNQRGQLRRRTTPEEEAAKTPVVREIPAAKKSPAPKAAPSSPLAGKLLTLEILK
jgi:hypothetical protein